MFNILGNIKKCLGFIQGRTAFIISIWLFVFICLAEQLATFFAFEFLGELGEQSTSPYFLTLMVSLIVVKIFSVALCAIQIFARNRVDAKLDKLYEEQQNATSENMQRMTDGIKSIQSARWLNLQMQQQNAFNESINELKSRKIEASLAEARLDFISDMFDYISDIAFWVFGIILLKSSVTSLGVFLAIYSIKDIFAQPFLCIAKLRTANIKNNVLKNRLSDILSIAHEDERQTKDCQIKSTAVAIEAQGLCFAYGDTPILTDFSATVKRCAFRAKAERAKALLLK